MHDRPTHRPGPLGNLYQSLWRHVTGSAGFFPSQFRYNLTVSHSARFVWFRVAKVGTRSVFNALENAGVQLDIPNGIFLHYPPNAWRGYLKFAFVRNPWERLVSCFHDRMVDRNHFQLPPAEHERLKDFGAFLDFVESRDLERCDVHLRLQSRLIDLNNIDELGRMETFDSDLARIFGRLKIPYQPLPPKNVSSRSETRRSPWTVERIERVARLYRRDIDIFGYQPPDISR